MLGYRRLRDFYTRNDLADGPFLAIVKKTDDLTTSRFADRIENISGRGDSGHARIIFQYRNACQTKPFCFSSEKLTLHDSVIRIGDSASQRAWGILRPVLERLRCATCLEKFYLLMTSRSWASTGLISGLGKWRKNGTKVRTSSGSNCAPLQRSSSRKASSG